jgi:hypothetical protein
MLPRMRIRDWCGVLRVAALGYVAVRVGGIAFALAGIVAALAAAGMVWDVCRERGWLDLGSGRWRRERLVAGSDPANLDRLTNPLSAGLAA